MEHETKHEKHEPKHHVKKVSKNNVMIGIMAVGVVLLIAISLQLSSVNKHLKAMDSKLGSLEDFFSKIKQPSPTQQAPEENEKKVPVDMKTLADDDAFKGSEDAPVTIVEFSDFECPFCARFYKQTLGKIEEEYIKTGKVKLVYRDYPLPFHTHAQKAAEAAECAGEQGKFWEMHNKLFEEGVKGGVESFKQFAADIGLDTEKFNDCLDSGKMAEEVQKDMKDGSAAGIRGTPGFIINGQLVSGAQPFENFKRVIESELAK
jgi:protein-disulfide isomerase